MVYREYSTVQGTHILVYAMAKCLGRRNAACFTLLALCVVITVSVLVLGELSALTIYSIAQSKLAV